MTVLMMVLHGHDGCNDSDCTAAARYDDNDDGDDGDDDDDDDNDEDDYGKDYKDAGDITVEGDY